MTAMFVNSPRWMIAALLTVATMSAALAQDAPVVLRYGNTTPMFSYDGRGDDRDFATNGVFPGNFAPDPGQALVGGAAGVTGGFYRHSPWPYPSQVYFPQDRSDCGLRHRHTRKRGACVAAR